MQTVEDLLKTLIHPKPDGLDPRIQMEYDQVNQNFRTLMEIRFKLLALVPPIGGIAVYALSELAGDPGKSVFVLLVSILGFLASLGIVFYDQRNSELYNALDGRARHLEYRAGFERNPLLDPSKSIVGGQFLERPPSNRRLFGWKMLLVKHDRGLALIYGPVLGAWFFPIVYSLLLKMKVTFYPRSIAIGFAAVAVVVFIMELLRLDGTFSDNRWGTVASYSSSRKIKLKYTVRDKPLTFTGLLDSNCKVEMHDGTKFKEPPAEIPDGACVKVWYKTKDIEIRDSEDIPAEKGHPVFKLKFLDEPKQPEDKSAIVNEQEAKSGSAE